MLDVLEVASPDHAVDAESPATVPATTATAGSSIR
jgi:hypothetical protein